MRTAVLLLACLSLPACATLVEGTNQSVTVSTDPPGASCILSRHGETVGAIALTPGSVQVSKSKDDVSVACQRQGFQTATVSRSPSFGGATFGNIIAGGVVGVVVDAASGANYTYPSEIHVSLAPVQPAPAMVAGLPTSTSVPVVPAATPVSVAAPVQGAARPVSD